MPRPAAWVALGIVGLAAVLRLVALGSPGEIYFDETYYANDARVYLRGVAAYDAPLDFHPDDPPSQPPPSVGMVGEKSWVHPPLGKWIIAAGDLLALRTDALWGFRLSAALFGVGTVALVFLIGMELFGPWWAALAALLAALDGLLIVQSRVSMLDSIVTGLVVLGVWLLLRSRDSPQVWWLLGAGAALGAAAATKWSGVLALAAGAGFAVAWASHRLRLRQRWPALVAAFVVVPAAIYLASYTGFFVDRGPSLRAFWHLQWEMLRYHTGLDETHLYQSSPWGWPLLLRPVAYFYQDTQGTIRHILAVGNPGLWWPFLLALPAVVARAVTRRGWDARLVAGFYLVQYVPWLVVGRVLFLFYMTPAVPFMALGMVLALRAVPWPRVRVAATGVVAGATVAGAAAFLPLWIGYGVDFAHWRRLMIFHSWI